MVGPSSQLWTTAYHVHGRSSGFADRRPSAGTTVAGVQIVMGDGSVHFVAESIERRVWRGLASIAGDELPQNF